MNRPRFLQRLPIDVSVYVNTLVSIVLVGISVAGLFLLFVCNQPKPNHVAHPYHEPTSEVVHARQTDVILGEPEPLTVAEWEAKQQQIRESQDDDSDERIAEIYEQIEQRIAVGASESGRSSKWPKVRNDFAALPENKHCACCGAKTTQIHHERPFHLFPELELDPTNLIPFCDRCHLLIGHLGNYQNYNPDVRKHIRIIHDAKAKADEVRIAAKDVGNDHKRADQPSKRSVAP